jgi:50S ribosomal protein L16 3-hydroxylase
MLQGLKWDVKDVADFLGRYLTEPKLHIVFDVPFEKLTLNDFKNNIAQSGVRLALKSQMMFTDTAIYLNGESIKTRPEDFALFKQLVNSRGLSASDCSLVLDKHQYLVELFYIWYEGGYLMVAEKRR